MDPYTVQFISKSSYSSVQCFQSWKDLIRPKLLPHQMRPDDDIKDINPDATPENTFLPTDILDYYKPGTLEPKGFSGK